MTYLALMGDATGPQFLLQNGQPLSRNILTHWLRQIMASAKVPGNFSSHSFRIGAATVVARNRVPDHLIQAIGRRSGNAYQLRTAKKGFDWVVPAFQGCHGHLPAAMTSGTPLTCKAPVPKLIYL